LTVVLQAAGTVTTNSGMHSYVVYRLLGNIHCADRSWIFICLIMEKSWKIGVDKEGAPWVKDFTLVFWSVSLPH